MFDFANIGEFVGLYGYVGIFVLVFFETMLFFMLPGDSFLFGAGILVSTNYLNFPLLVLAIFVSTFLAGWVSYYIGINIERLRKYKFFRNLLKEKYIEEGYSFFEKYGLWAIVLSRFVGNFRTFVPMVAGISRMSNKSFLKANFLGSIIRAIIVPLAGLLLGGIFPQIEKIIPYAMILAVLVAIFPIFIFFFRKKPKEDI